MNVGTLVALCGKRFREEQSGHADELINETDWIAFLNDGQNEAVRRMGGVKDARTGAVCSGTVTMNDPWVSVETLVLRIENVMLTSTGRHLTRRSVHEMESVVVSDYGHRRSGSEWRRRKGTPTIYVPDMERNAVRLVCIPVASDAVWMDVWRMPLAPLINAADNPELPEYQQFAVTDWALHRAFSIDDVETEDSRKSSAHERDFERMFGPPITAEREANRFRRTHRPARYGGL